jgi:hypothetical protein
LRREERALALDPEPGGRYNRIVNLARLILMTRVALLAVSGLIAVSACTGEPNRSQPPVPARSTATQSPRVAWADLAVGHRPKIPYVRGHRYVVPDRKALALPAGRRGVSGVVAFSGGLLVSDATYFEATNGVDLVKRGVTVESWRSASHCSSGAPIASSDGRYVAWVTVRCPEGLDRSIGAIHRARADGSDKVTQPVGPGLARVVGLLGRRVVYNAGFQDGAWIADFRSDPRRVPGVDSVRAVDPRTGWFIGQRGDRSRLVLRADGTVRWRLRAGDLIAFSPDGKMVLGTPGGLRLWVLRGRDGSTAASVDLPAGAQVWPTVWETSRTVLTLLRYRGEVAIVRVYLDGRIERVTAPVRLVDGRSPYVLLTPAPMTTARRSGNAAVTACRELPPIPLDREIDRSVDAAKGLLSFSYRPDGAEEDVTYVIDYKNDASCAQRADTAALIEQSTGN